MRATAAAVPRRTHRQSTGESVAAGARRVPRRARSRSARHPRAPRAGAPPAVPHGSRRRPRRTRAQGRSRWGSCPPRSSGAGRSGWSRSAEPESPSSPPHGHPQNAPLNAQPYPIVPSLISRTSPPFRLPRGECGPGTGPTRVSPLGLVVAEQGLASSGTLAEGLRAGGTGIPAFCTPAGDGTRTALALRPDGGIRAASLPKETRTSGGRTYTLEEAITTDFALVRAARGDRHGNLVLHRSVADFNPLAARTGRITFAEVEEPDRARRPRRRRRCHHAPVHRRHRHRSRCLRATTGRPEVAPRRGVVVSGQSAGVRATSELPERDGRPSGGVSV